MATSFFFFTFIGFLTSAFAIIYVIYGFICFLLQHYEKEEKNHKFWRDAMNNDYDGNGY